MEIPTLPVDQCHSHLIHFLVECLAVLLECRAAEKDRQAFGTHMVYRETFLQIQSVASSSTPYPQELNAWSSGKEEPLHSSTVEKRETNTRSRSSLDSQPKILSSSAEDSSKNCGVDFFLTRQERTNSAENHTKTENNITRGPRKPAHTRPAKACSHEGPRKPARPPLRGAAGRGTISPNPSPRVHQRQSQSSSSSARKDGPPPHPPCLFPLSCVGVVALT